MKFQVLYSCYTIRAEFATKPDIRKYEAENMNLLVFRLMSIHYQNKPTTDIKLLCDNLMFMSSQYCTARYAVKPMGKQICFCDKKTKKMRPILFDIVLSVSVICLPKLVLICGKCSYIFVKLKVN